MKNEANESLFDADDARLSAYALGELDGDERAEIEALLERDANARAFVDELRATAASLERELATEPALELTIAQRASIDARTQRVAYPRRWVWLGAAAAGILAAGACAYFAGRWRGVRLAEHELAQRPTAKTNSAVTRLGVEVDTYTVADEPSLAKNDAGDELPEPIDRSGTIDPNTLTEDELAEGIGQVGGSAAIGCAAPSARRMAHGGSGMPAKKQRAEVRLRGMGYDAGDTARADKPSGANTEAYHAIVENAFKLATQDPLSTFSIDVDTASYANVRRFITNGSLPPPDAVRVEELLNYFRYDYPKASGDVPFSVSANVATCPWAQTHKLVQVGLRGLDIDLSKRPVSNLVFLVDVSGSMNEPDKLPLLVSSLRLLVQQLDGRDRLALVVYAGNSGLVLPSTTCDYKTVIANALESLQAGGSTNGGAGIELAYQIAQQNFTKEGQNRVILCTDGDFNVGTTDEGSLQRLIEEKRQTGVFLSVLGFGRGNVKDSTMELLADKGNGNYAYIDTLAEARKVLVHELGGTLVTIAKDVKIQVEFNPAQVQAWRLVGYENRVLAHQDFNDDKKDAGEIGAGHTVTALYEVVPVGVALDVPGVDPLRYQTTTQPSAAAFSGELLNLKLRYKRPDSDTSQLLTTPVRDAGASWQEASADFKFAAAVAGFGLVLRKSANVGSFTLQDAHHLAVQGVGEDVGGYRKEFVELVQQAQQLASGEKR